MGETSISYSNDSPNLTVQHIREVYEDSPGELKSLNRLAAQICGTPISLVNLLDENFQYTVSKSGDWDSDITPMNETVCQFTVKADELLIINDTRKDERTKVIKELTRDESIRFYAGVPINSPEGSRIGAFCVVDYEPKQLTEDQKQALKDLGREVQARIRLLKQKKSLERKNEKLQEASAFLENSADILLVAEPQRYNILKSKGAEPLIGVSDARLIGQSLFDLVREINIQKHIKNWVSDGYEKKLGIPVKLDLETGRDIWLNLTFTHYEDTLLITGRDITQQHQAEQQLKESLEEKEILLSEIHHRVKNNLAVVNSLLQLERNKTDDREIQDILKKSESRIITIAKVHEVLYQSNNFTNVDLEGYIQQIIAFLQESLIPEDQSIDIDLKVADVNVNVNQALPVGMIINELVNNALKHAFVGRESGTVSVNVAEHNSKKVKFMVADNGRGLEFDPFKSDEIDSLGFTLIEALKKQLNADLEIKNGQGTSFQFTFEKDRRKGVVNNL